MASVAKNLELSLRKELEMSRRYFLTVLLIACVPAGLLLTLVCNDEKGSEVSSPVVVATPWTWATVAATPIPVVNNDPKEEELVGLFQVKFRVTDTDTPTAFLNAGTMPGRISPWSNNWKVGDKILIVSVPGNDANGRPQVTYFVTDWKATKPETHPAE